MMIGLHSSLIQRVSLWLSPFTLLLFGELLALASANFRPKVEVMTMRDHSKSKLFENSPIFYLKIASNLRNINNNKNSMATSTVNGLLGKRNSNLYKLPLQFVSNAKPVDIIQGIAGKKTVKVPYKVPSISKFYKHSKVFYLPTKFVSNGKPLKPIVLAIGKRKLFHAGRRTPLAYTSGLRH